MDGSFLPERQSTHSSSCANNWVGNLVANIRRRGFTIYATHLFVWYCRDGTRAAYRDAFRLFFEFAESQLQRRPAQLELNDISVSIVLSFLTYLEDTRMNTTRTRNSRLAAIRLFMHYVSMKEPTALAATEQILTIPVKRYERPLIGFLSREQIEAILESPNEKAWSGRRDRVMFATLYNTGARISELTSMRVSDVVLAPNASVQIHGKGRKLRSVPLWKNTARQLRHWLEFSKQTVDHFPNNG